MNIPNFLDIRFIDKDGKLTPQWRSILNNLFTELQTKSGTEGLFLPIQSNDHVLMLNTARSIGALIYNTTTNQFMACVPNGDSGIFRALAFAGGSQSYTSITLDNLNPNTALICDSSLTVQSSITTSTELSYVHGVTSDIQTQLNGKVPTSRIISTTSPLQGGGDLSIDRTFSITQATTSTSGYLSNTDWNTFNGKQNALSFGNLSTSGNLSGSGTNVLVGSSVTIGVATGYAIPSNTQITNWNSAYSLTSAATALDTSNTLVLRDANGRTAVSLSDDNVIPRISLNHNTRQLFDQNGHIEIDWEARQTYEYDNSTNYLSVDWGNFQLWAWWKHYISFHPPRWEFLAWMSIDWKQCACYGTDTLESINWDGHYLNFYGMTALSVDYGGGALYDQLSYPALDWVNRWLLDSAGINSVDWANRQLLDQAGNISFDWINGAFYIAGYAIDYLINCSNQSLQDINGYGSISWGLRYLIDSAGRESMSYDLRMLTDTNGDTGYGNSLDWQNRQAFDDGLAGTIPNRLSIDWQNRYLCDIYGNPIVDWGNYVLSDQDGFSIINFGNGIFLLNDNGGHQSVDFDNRQLINGFGSVLDWSNTDRIVINTALTLTPTSTVPSTPPEGTIYVDSTSGNHLKIYLNSAWHTII